MTNETSAERIQRRWDEGAPKRAARSKANKAWSVLIALALIAVLLGVVALAVWFLVVSGGIILKLAGAVLIVVVASLAWQQMRGH